MKTRTQLTYSYLILFNNWTKSRAGGKTKYLSCDSPETMFPTEFLMFSPDRFPDDAPADFQTSSVSVPEPRPVKKWCTPIPSHRPKVLPTFPPHFHPTVNKRKHFPVLSLGKSQQYFRGGNHASMSINRLLSS